MEELILALDAGTSCVKAALVRRNLEVVSSAEAALSPPADGGYAGGAEQDSEAWWAAAVGASKQLTRPEGALVTLIALSGQMQSTLLLHADGAPLTPALLYCDSRAEAEAAAIAETHATEAASLENYKGAVSILPKLRWLLAHAPAAVADAAQLALSSNDLLFARLTAGCLLTDPTNASTTGLLQQHAPAAAWATEPLASAGVPAALVGMLPPIRHGAAALAPLGETAAAALGQKVLGGGSVDFLEWRTSCVRVHHGAGDLGTTTVGAMLACASASTYVYLGTSGWVAMVRRAAGGAAPHAPRAFSVRNPTDDGVIYAVPMTTAGGNVRWLCGLLFAGLGEHAALAAFNAEADRAPAGCDGLLFLPYLRGERCPVSDPHARACFVGLGAEATRGHMCRAVLEGICLAVRSLAALLPPEELLPPLPPLPLVGGVGNSAVLAQCLADVLQREIVVPAGAAHVPAIGAAALALEAVGVKVAAAAAGAAGRPGVVDGQGEARRYTPRAHHASLYDAAYQRFCGLYPALKETFVASPSLQRAARSPLAPGVSELVPRRDLPP